MFELESDPAFDFTDPMIAAAISDSIAAGPPELFADLLFRKGEEDEDSEADEMFDA